MTENMKRVFMLAAVVLLCVTGTVFAAQKDSYRQKVKILMAQGGEVNEMETQIREALQKNIPADAMLNDTLRQMVTYLENDLFGDLTDSFEQSARKYMTEDDLDQIIAWMQRPESQSVHAKEKQLAARMQAQDPEVMALMGALVNNMAAVMQGQQPAPMPASHQSPAYVAAFHEYYEASNVGATLRQTYDGVLSTLAQYMQGDPTAEEKLRSATDYMTQSLEPLMLLLYEDVYTEDDLHYYTAFCQTQAYQHQAQASQDFAANIGTMLIKILGKFGIQM